MDLKKFSTRVLLGVFFSVLCSFVFIQIAFNVIGNKSLPTHDSEEVLLIRASVTAYVKNHFFHSKDSEMTPLTGLEKYFRPEVQAALESGATLKVRREDLDNAVISMLLETSNAPIEEKNKNKKKEELRALFTRDDIVTGLEKQIINGWWWISGGALLFVCLVLAWYFLHDPVIRIFNQYKKGRLYNTLEREILDKDREFHQQKGYTTHWKTKAEELETAYQALNQKYNTLYSHLKEKQEAEKAATEKVKIEKEKEKALEEKAKNAFS
jgi:hypothetical protein